MESASAARPDEEAATSPDLLKNTPSNIARLEDVIEQCKGREKYRARTASPSDGEDVRWYFCKIPLAPKGLSASVPRTEIVGKSDYFRFSVRDSLALEASFLQREEDLLTHWWKEFAECSEGPRGFNMTSKISSSSEDTDLLYAIDEERLGVPVKGGLYEVDLVKRHCFPVYWNGENRRVLRGHWFARKGNLDWLPLREDIAEQLELAYHCQVWHRRTFQPSGLFAARVDLQGATKGLHVLFTGEDATWEAFFSTDNSGFSLGTGKGNTYKLRRGFSSSGCQRPTQDELRQQREEEMDDYCSQVPVGHLVFMVHGIGQRLEKSNLVDDVGNFRHITASLAERHLSPYQRSIQRVLYIPCQWRRGLELSGEHAVEQITLDGVRGLRVTLSATVHDVLYYMSPIYCQDIIDSVSNQLNKLYKKFLKRNPGYNGKVSIYGHSLGSVLSYDILCHQENLSSPFPMHQVCMESEREKGQQKEVDNRMEEPNKNDTCDFHSENTSVQLAEASAPLEKEKSKTSDVAHNDVSTVAVSSIPSKLQEASVRDHKIDSPVEGAETTLFTDLTSSKEGSNFDVEPEAIASEQMEPRFDVTNEFQDDNTESLKDAIELGCHDKDELIIMLKEEVKSLKAKLVALTQKDDGKKKDEGTQIRSTGNQSEEQVFPIKSYTPYIKYTKLDFKVDTFFAVGSPLGVFLALRNIRIGIGKGQDYWQDVRISEEMPSCRQMFNIFHPFDPVAYRIEPLVSKEYLSKRPVIIPYHRGGKRLHIGIQEFTEDVAACSQAVVSRLNSVKVKVVSVFYSRNKDTLEDAINGAQHKERSYGAIMMERLTGSENGRVDHVLQDKTFEHPYISALGAHTNYWRDFDTALFILKHLYRDIPEELDVAGQDREGNVEIKRKQIELFFQNEAMEEDIPLTFSDKPMVREFARKARKAMSSS